MYSINDVVVYCQEISTDGHMPTVQEYDNNRPENLPCKNTLLQRWRWGVLADKAGLKLSKRSAGVHYDFEVARANIISISIDGLMPSKDHYDSVAVEKGWISYNTISNHNGGWRNTAERCGLKYSKGWSSEMLISIGKKLSSGEFMTPEHWDNNRPAGAPKAENITTKYFSSWNDYAYDCGYQPKREVTKPVASTREEIKKKAYAKMVNPDFMKDRHQPQATKRVK